MLHRQPFRGGYLDPGYYDWPPPSLAEVRARWLSWLWLLALGIGLVALAAYVVSHDDPHHPGLTDRSWLTLALAAALVALLSFHRVAGVVPLLRALAEYSVVALLVVLLATGPGAFAPAARHPARPAGRAGAHATTRAGERAATAGKQAAHGCPPVRQVLAWAGCLWRQANPLSTKPTPGPSRAPSPAASSTRRSP